jgi:polyhydroxyalkanoate synthesis repressor PhaR
MAQMHLIKKYANRRLYDTTASQHVTLDGIRKLIIQGNDVQIVDDASGEDLTRSLLLQIIADQEQGGRPMLETGFLTRLIRLYGNPMQELMGEYLSRSFDTFTQQQTAFQEQMRAAMASMPMTTLQEIARSNVEAWQAMQDAMLGKRPAKKDETE